MTRRKERDWRLKNPSENPKLWPFRCQSREVKERHVTLYFRLQSNLSLWKSESRFQKSGLIQAKEGNLWVRIRRSR